MLIFAQKVVQIVHALDDSHAIKSLRKSILWLITWLSLGLLEWFWQIWLETKDLCHHEARLFKFQKWHKEKLNDYEQSVSQAANISKPIKKMVSWSTDFVDACVNIELETAKLFLPVRLYA